MILQKHLRTQLPTYWFWVGILCIAVLSFGLRFWGLDRFNTLVFDEIYFAKFARNYLTNTPFFDAHPPLGKYLIALGIALKGFNPWGYRWMNAIVGGLIPLLGAAIAYQISFRRSFALIAGFLLCLDGLLLVESRYALINVYLLFFGLAGQLCLLLATHAPKTLQRIGWLLLASIMFGATISVKWNGLGLLLGFHLLWILTQGAQWARRRGWIGGIESKRSRRQTIALQSLNQLTFADLFLLLPVIAIGIYGLVWIPHLFQNDEFSLLTLNYKMFTYHAGVGNGVETHPYCSTWWTWPLMIRPVSYFFEIAQTLAEPVPIVGPTLPLGAARYYYSVYALGNPILWWLSTASLLGIAILGVIICFKVFKALTPQLWQSPVVNLGEHSARTAWIALYIGINYGSNLLPWAAITRCAFLYHYLPANIFGVLALSWGLDELFQAQSTIWRGIAIAILVLIIAGFIFWLPLFLGLPLTPEGWRLRIWLSSWV